LWLEKAERAKERILRRSKTVNPQSLWSKLHQQGFSGATISAALRDLPQPEL
jgi:SOS response regulatory protein OraA/RecX